MFLLLKNIYYENSMKNQIVFVISSSRIWENITSQHYILRCCFSQCLHTFPAFNKNKLLGSHALKDVRTSTNHSNNDMRILGTLLLQPPPTEHIAFSSFL